MKTFLTIACALATTTPAFGLEFSGNGKWASSEGAQGDYTSELSFSVAGSGTYNVVSTYEYGQGPRVLEYTIVRLGNGNLDIVQGEESIGFGVCTSPGHGSEGSELELGTAEHNHPLRKCSFVFETEHGAVAETMAFFGDSDDTLHTVKRAGMTRFDGTVIKWKEVLAAAE